MFGAKHREVKPARDPLEGRLLEGRSIGEPNLVDHCQNALNTGAYSLLFDASPVGAVVRLDLQDQSYIAAIALDPSAQGASIHILHRVDGHDDEVALKMAAVAFGAG